MLFNQLMSGYEKVAGNYSFLYSYKSTIANANGNDYHLQYWMVIIITQGNLNVT
jgi:hypothetical protein